MNLSSDGFCTQYQKVIREKGDGTIVAKSSVKKRIAANEVIFSCQCEGSKLSYCTSTPAK